VRGGGWKFGSGKESLQAGDAFRPAMMKLNDDAKTLRASGNTPGPQQIARQATRRVRRNYLSDRILALVYVLPLSTARLALRFTLAPASVVGRGAGPGGQTKRRLPAEGEGTMNTVLAVLAGGLFVVVYAWHRFSNPSANRASTTAVRYYAAALSYCLWGVVLYALLVIGLTLSPDIARSLSPALGTEFHKLIVELRNQGLSYPLVVALLLTTLLPNIPVIAYADRRVREQLEHMAAIPYEVRRLSAELGRSDSLSGVTFAVSRPGQERVRHRLLEHDFRREDIVFNGGSDLRTLWTKVAVLMLHLEDWRAERKFSGFCESCVEKPDEIAQTYEDLLPRVRRCLRALRAPASGSSESETRGAVSEYRAEVERQVRQFLGRLYRFISAATLQCELTQEDRAQRLSRLGFHFSQSWRPSPLLLAHRLAALFTALFVVLLSSFTIMISLDPDTRLGYPRAFGLSVMVPLTYVVAVFWAIFLKDRWAHITRRREGTRPHLSYLLAGLLAAVSNVRIGLVWTSISGDSPGGVGLVLFKSLIWVMLSATTAVVTALLIDDQPRSWARRWGGRWSEGAVQSAATAAMAFVVYLMLKSYNAAPRSPVEMVVLLAAIIGFIIGALIPTWYREAPRRREDTNGIESVRSGGSNRARRRVIGKRKASAASAAEHPLAAPRLRPAMSSQAFVPVPRLGPADR
jgi:hypothetical protein